MFETLRGFVGNRGLWCGREMVYVVGEGVEIWGKCGEYGEIGGYG